MIKEISISVELLQSLTDDEPCWFDHNGGCQAHGYLGLQPGELCPQFEAKRSLEAVSNGLATAEPTGLGAVIEFCRLEGGEPERYVHVGSGVWRSESAVNSAPACWEHFRGMHSIKLLSPGVAPAEEAQQ